MLTTFKEMCTTHPIHTALFLFSNAPDSTTVYSMYGSFAKCRSSSSTFPLSHILLARRERCVASSVSERARRT